MMFAALLVVLLRSPILLLHGRVFAEEATVYLQQAWDARPLQTMLAVREGYFSLLMNGFTLLGAKLVPLEWVAVTYTFGALCVLMLTVYLALVCESFTTPRARALAAAIVIFAPATEVWLTLLDAQFYLPVCVALICISAEDRHRLLRYGTLVLAGLTGPVSCALTPCLLMKAWRRRTVDAWLQAAILVAASAVQGTILLHSLHAGSRKLDSTVKFGWFGPILFVKTFSVTLFTRLGGFASQRLLSHHPDAAVRAVLWVLALGSLWLFWRVARLGGWPGRMMFAMALLSLVFNYAGDPAPAAVIFTGEFRYFFSGTMLLWFCLLLGYDGSVGGSGLKWHRVATVLLSVALFSGVVDAIGYWGRFQRIEPRWAEQVAAWRKDPAVPIRVAPASWTDSLRLGPR